MEIIIWITGLVAGGLFGWICGKPTTKVNWNPNDYAVPEALALIDLKGLDRGFSVEGASVVQTWKYKGCTQSRVITKQRGVLTYKEFEDLWYENELNFYLKHKELFDQERKKCAN